MKKQLLASAALCASLFCGVGRAATVPFPGVPNLRQNPHLSYGGFFRKHQPVKILFAVGQPGPQLKESLINSALVIRYLKSKGYRYKVHIVFYSKAVLVTDEYNQKYAAWAPLLRALHRQGVTFTVCHNAMELFHVKSPDVYSFMHVIPAGILSIVQYEMEGYSPVFNPNSEAK
ncbi:MAG: DsrE family protein [Acidiferrobacteraceae bacterium]